MLWLIWIVLILLVPTVAGMQVWWQLHHLPPAALPTARDDHEGSVQHKAHGDDRRTTLT
jgi:hypothetical protein